MRLFPSLSALLSASVLSVSAATASDDAIKELQAYNDRYNEIVQAPDVEAFVALYNDNPLWIAPAEPPVAGLEVPRGALQFLAENGGILTHSADHVLVSKDGSLAVLIGQYDVEIAKLGHEAAGTYLFILQHNDDEWDIVVDMFNEHDRN